MPENLRERHWTTCRETIRTGKTRYGDGDVVAGPALGKGGTRISIEFMIFPYRHADSTLHGVEAILRDVTKRFEEAKTPHEEIKARRKEAAAWPTNPLNASLD